MQYGGEDMDNRNAQLKRTDNDAARSDGSFENDANLGTDYFEVSKLVESPEMLRGWIDWFTRHDIPCFIEKRRSSKYVLWRKGMEVGAKGCKPTLHAKKIVYRSDL
jgi:hypothetical protein